MAKNKVIIMSGVIPRMKYDIPCKSFNKPEDECVIINKIFSIRKSKKTYSKEGWDSIDGRMQGVIIENVKPAIIINNKTKYAFYKKTDRDKYFDEIFEAIKNG